MAISPYVSERQKLPDFSGVRGVTPQGEPLNSPEFGGYNRSGTPKLSGQRPEYQGGSPKNAMFDDGGEVNAYNNRHALEQIKYLLDQMATGQIQGSLVPQDQGPMATDEEKRQIMAEAFRDPSGEGFALVGAELLGPVRTVLDFEGWARRVLGPRPVKQGEIIRYDRDVFVVGYVIAEDGQTPETRVGGRFIFPPEFEITALPTIELRDIFQSQYDILARLQDRSRQAIELQEDRSMKSLLDASATVENTLTVFSTLTLGDLENIRLQVERHRLVVDKFLINRREMSDIITQISTEVDPVTQRELIMAGYIGSILNTMILTSAGTNTFETILPGEVFAVTNQDYLGGMPIRVELFSEPVSHFLEGKPTRGWYWYELLAQVVFNPRAVSKGIRQTP